MPAGLCLLLGSRGRWLLGPGRAAPRLRAPRTAWLPGAAGPVPDPSLFSLGSATLSRPTASWFPQPPPSPLPSLSLGPTAVTASPAQLSPSPAQSTSPAGSGLLKPSSKLNIVLPSPTAQPAPLEFLRLEHPNGGKPGSTPHSPSAATGLGSLQGREHKPASSAADWQGLGVDPSPHPLLDFPLLSSAQVHF